jgi:ketopantoate hydroxymethyltransferase
MEKNKLSVAGLRATKGTGRRLKMVTAYDYPSAVLVDRSAVDIILVGDSLGNNVLGYDGTTPVTMEEVLHHLQPVVRGAPHTMIVADMPFGSARAQGAHTADREEGYATRALQQLRPQPRVHRPHLAQQRASAH